MRLRRPFPSLRPLDQFAGAQPVHLNCTMCHRRRPCAGMSSEGHSGSRPPTTVLHAAPPKRRALLPAA